MKYMLSGGVMVSRDPERWHRNLGIKCTPKFSKKCCGFLYAVSLIHNCFITIEIMKKNQVTGLTFTRRSKTSTTHLGNTSNKGIGIIMEHCTKMSHLKKLIANFNKDDAH